MVGLGLGKQRANFVNAKVEEARACLFALKNTLEAEHDGLIVEGDCLQLVQRFQSNDPQDNFIGLIIHDI